MPRAATTRARRKLSLKGTRVLQENLAAKSRIVLNEGGTRSSKTISIAQLILIKALQEQNITIDICRKTLPALKATAWLDFQTLLEETGFYDARNHNKTDRTYKLGTNTIRYYSVDEPQKIRGWKRHYLWLNEANEFDLEDWRQLSLRTTGQIFLDYNPSDEFHWIYDQIQPRDDCTIIHSTYKDNPFLPEAIVDEIERLKDQDENFHRVYALGLRGISQETVFTKWDLQRFPDGKWPDAIVYGLDFGYNNPSALAECRFLEKDLYVRELVYQTHLTNDQLIETTNSLGLNRDLEYYGDAGEPDRIESFGLAGYNIYPAKKSVNDGINAVKSFRLHVDPDSTNLQKEIRSYKWRVDRHGRTLDEVVKFNDHLLDAIRYAVFSHGKTIGDDLSLTFGRTRRRR